MKARTLFKAMLVSAALATLAGCNTIQPNTTVAAVTPAAEKIQTNVTVEIEKSGLATPSTNQGTVTGYDFKRGFMIPAEIGNYFGFRYQAKQVLAVTAGTTKVTGEIKASLPVTVRAIHPEMLQANGQTTTESSWQDTLYFGRPNYSMWQFESENERVDGQWTIRLEYQGNVIAEKNFLVRKPVPKPAKVTEVCTAAVAMFPQPLAEAHEACCSNGNAQACYNFAYRGMERLRDKVGAALYYQRGCELGDISSCRMAGRMAKAEEDKQTWYNKGCDLKDLDSCLEVGRLPK